MAFAVVRRTFGVTSASRVSRELARLYPDAPIAGKFHTLEEIVTLPGVGPKIPNAVLGDAFGKPGIVVNTHFARLARGSAGPRMATLKRSSATSPRCWFPDIRSGYVVAAHIPRTGATS